MGAKMDQTSTKFCPRALLGLPWGPLGLSWASLGRLLGNLGASWRALGGVFGASWGVLAAKTGAPVFWTQLGAVLEAMLAVSWCSWKPFFHYFLILS